MRGTYITRKDITFLNGGRVYPWPFNSSRKRFVADRADGTLKRFPTRRAACDWIAATWPN